MGRSIWRRHESRGRRNERVNDDCGHKTLDTNIIGAIFISSIVVFCIIAILIKTARFSRHLSRLNIYRDDFLLYYDPNCVGCVLYLADGSIGNRLASKLPGCFWGGGRLDIHVFGTVLIPTGLHHFIYTPFIYGPAVAEGGIVTYWAQHLGEYSQSAKPLKELFPQGGFALHGNSKIFGIPGIALAFYVTAKKERKNSSQGC